MISNKNNEKRANIIFPISDVRTPQTPPPPSKSGFVRIFRTPPRGGRPDVLCECPLTCKEFQGGQIGAKYQFWGAMPPPLATWLTDSQGMIKVVTSEEEIYFLILTPYP